MKERKPVQLDRQCDFCPKPATYDFKTAHGPWAYGCDEHFYRYSTPNTILFTRLRRTMAE